jgi:tetratricopeptide (TPR) repeat protein
MEKLTPFQMIESNEKRSVELLEIFKSIGEGKLKEAEISLSKYIAKKPKPSKTETLDCYAHLIRIAASLRQFDKIPPYIESLKKISVETKLEKIKYAKCLYMTGNGWLYAGNLEKARTHFNLSLQIASDLADEYYIFINQFALVEILRLEGHYEEVLSKIESLKVAAEASNNASNLGNVWILLGNVYRKQGNYNSAIQAYEKGRTLFNENKNGESYHYILWALGTCYAALEDKEKAKIYLELASHSNSDHSVEFWRINVLSILTLAELHTVVGEYDNATKLYEKAEKLAGNDENNYYGRRVLRGQALLFIKKGEFDKSSAHIDKLVVVALKEKNTAETMRLRLLKAEVLLRNGDSAQHDEARAMLQEALAYFKERGVRRHQTVSLELLARLDSRSSFPADAFKKVSEMLILAEESSFERLIVRAQLAQMVLSRKLGRSVTSEQLENCLSHVSRLNAHAERVILKRFTAAGYDEWSQDLRRLDPHMQRYVNEFFEDFHFVPNQIIDVEIDQNSHYVREKHLGEIPFHNKFTLMRILCLLAENPGREYSKEQLAKDIWGQEYNPLRHDNNIYININRLRKLIEPNPRESRYVMNGSRGYYFNPAMKVNISTKISDVAPRMQPPIKPLGIGTIPEPRA